MGIISANEDREINDEGIITEERKGVETLFSNGAFFHGRNLIKLSK